jgi:DNA-binding response OmpR family regulator
MPSKFLPFVFVEDSGEDSEAFLTAFGRTRVPNELVILKGVDDAHHHFSEVAARKRDLPALTLVHLGVNAGSGVGLIEWIRSFAQLKTMPVVALAKEYDFQELERSYDSGANLYLLKPNHIREWADLVFRLQGYWSGQSEQTMPQLL